MLQSKLDETEADGDDEEDESDDDEDEDSEKVTGKNSVDKKGKDSSESLEEIDDEEDAEDGENIVLVGNSSENKNALYVLELKDVPPTSLTVADVHSADDDSKKDLSSDVPNTSSSFLSTSSESDSE